jgi:hypothetical protein
VQWVSHAAERTAARPSRCGSAVSQRRCDRVIGRLRHRVDQCHGLLAAARGRHRRPSIRVLLQVPGLYPV